MTTARDAGASDADLVQRIERHDPRALGEIYDRYGGALYSRMLRAAGQRRAAEDLLTETLLRAWNRIGTLEAGGALEPWLMSIARETAPRWEPAHGAPPPSPKLRRRILAAAGHQPFGWAPFLAAAAVLAFSTAVYFGGRERTFAMEVSNLRGQLGRQEVALTHVDEAISILSAPGTAEKGFAAAPVRGKVFLNPQQGLVLIASKLTPAPSGKVYEAWLFRTSAAPIPAGLVQPRPDGTVLHVVHEPVDVASIASFGLTLENLGGASQPGLPPFLTIPLH